MADRFYPPKQYPAQLIMMTTDDMDRFVRTLARLRGVYVTEVLREFTQGGIEGLPKSVRDIVLETMAMEDDGDEGGVAQGGR